MVWVRPDVVGVALAFLLMYVAWQTPVWRARRKEDARRNSVERELVDALGEMVMCVEAGLTLEAAMNIYANRHSSPLADEFRGIDAYDAKAYDRALPLLRRAARACAASPKARYNPPDNT
jgi:Flp pilus assembly protein TadB